MGFTGHVVSDAASQRTMGRRLRIAGRLPLACTLLVALGVAEGHAGSKVATRYLLAGKSESGDLVVLGREVEVRWKGTRKSVRWSDEDVQVKPLRAVLLRNGKKTRLRPRDPMDSEVLATAVYDAHRDLIVLLTYGHLKTPGRCETISAEGVVAACHVPEVFNEDRSYLHGEGRWLHYVAWDETTDEKLYREMDLTTGKVGELSNEHAHEALDKAPPAVPIRIDGRDCPPDGAPLSPSGEVTAWQCADVIECRGNDLSRQARLIGARVGYWLSPVASTDCSGVVDAAASIPWEQHSFIWSHDGAWIYWCGVGQETGYLVSRDCSRVVTGPCLRAASWSAKDESIVGVTKCGHEVTEWQLPGNPPSP